MNFAEELRTWRNSEPSILECENFVKKVVESKVNSIVTEIKKQGDIGVISFNRADFVSWLTETSRLKYQKEITLKTVNDLFESVLTKNTNIIHVFDVFKDDIVIIFYANNSEITSESLFNFIKQWFDKIVLPDFKKKYMEWHTDNISFSSEYMHEYSLGPFISINEKHRCHVTIQEMEKELKKLSKSNGLSCLVSTYDNRLRLFI